MFGGIDSKKWTVNLEALVPGSNHWKKVSDMPKIGGYWAAAALPGHVYLVGGGPANRILSDTCLRYDFPTNEWFEASLHLILSSSPPAQAANLLHLSNSCTECGPPFPCGLVHIYSEVSISGNLLRGKTL